MTQALINSLQILSDKQFNLADKMPKNTGMDFGKLFETKTGDISQSAANVQYFADKNRMQKPTSDSYKLPKKTEFERNHDQNKALKNNTEVTKDINNNIKNEPAKNDSAQNETDKKENILLNGFVEEHADNETQDAEEVIVIAENAAVVNEEDEEETIINITDESENTEETTITEEDSTMYKELITLENPTAFIMLQSQISQTVKQTLQEEQSDTAEQSASLKENTLAQNSKDNAESAIFKQFDTSVTKDAVITANISKKAVNVKPENDKLSGMLNKNMIKEMNVEVVTSQSANTESSMGDLMQNQSPQEQTARIMIQGDVKYDAVAAEAAKAATQAKTVNINPSKIIDQITKQLDGMFNNSKINLVLTPGSLGKLNLQLMNTKDGLIAQFTATTQEARDLIMKGLEGLKESLLAQGINVDNVSVKLEETESEYKQDYTEQEGSKGGNKHQGAKKQKENEKNFEEMMFELEKDGNV